MATRRTCAAFPALAATDEISALEREKALLAEENASLRELVRMREENAALRKRLGQDTSGPPIESSPLRGAPSAISPAHIAPVEVFRRQATRTVESPGYAADLGPAYKAPPPVAYNWTGFYVGGHLGAGWARKQWTDPNPICHIFNNVIAYCDRANLGSHNAIGPLGRFQAGINWQTGYFVLGIEAQYSFANLKGDHHDVFAGHSVAPSDGGTVFTTFTQSDLLSTTVKGIGTIAGRIGLTSWPSDRTLFYLKGGAAYVREDFRESIDRTFVDCPSGGGSCGVPVTHIGEVSARQSRWGWMAGAGLEYGLFDNWSAKVEYNYLNFGEKTVRLEGSECEVFVNDCFSTFRNRAIRQDMHVIKLGINYRFGWGKALVVARY